MVLFNFTTSPNSSSKAQFISQCRPQATAWWQIHEVTGTLCHAVLLQTAFKRNSQSKKWVLHITFTPSQVPSADLENWLSVAAIYKTLLPLVSFLVEIPMQLPRKFKAFNNLFTLSGLSEISIDSGVCLVLTWKFAPIYHHKIIWFCSVHVFVIERLVSIVATMISPQDPVALKNVTLYF